MTNMTEYFLKPGYIYYASGQTSILTVIGSSVAISMYDRNYRIGGMNHFFQPKLDENSSPTAIFAKPSTLQLIRLLHKNGSALDSIEAQIFGGAARDDDSEELKKIGKSNVETAIQLLEFYGINVIGLDIGGKHGRKIIFNVYTGEVIIAKVEKIRREDWYPGFFQPPFDRKAYN